MRDEKILEEQKKQIKEFIENQKVTIEVLIREEIKKYQEYQKLVDELKLNNENIITSQKLKEEKILEELKKQIKEYHSLIENLEKSNKEFLKTFKTTIEEQLNKNKEYQNLDNILKINNEKIITNQKLQNETIIQELKNFYEKLLREQLSKMEEQKKISEEIIELLSQVLLKDLLDKHQGNIQELINKMKK